TTIQEGSQTSVAAVLRDLLEDNQPQLQQQGIDVTVQVDETLALAQPASLLQILFGNILRNAIEHTRNGRIEIEGNSESLRFRDTGSGIAPEHLPRVFERSFTTKESGIGLGLDLVRRICERCGWQVTLDSEPGAGTTVTIRF